MARMLDELGPRGRRAWDLLDAVHDDRLTLGALYDAWRMNDLDGLRARMTDENLAAHIPAWRVWLADRVKASTAELYVVHLRTLMPEGKPYLRSEFTGPAVALAHRSHDARSEAEDGRHQAQTERRS